MALHSRTCALFLPPHRNLLVFDLLPESLKEGSLGQISRIWRHWRDMCETLVLTLLYFTLQRLAIQYEVQA